MFQTTTLLRRWDFAARQSGASGRVSWKGIVLIATLTVVGGQRLPGAEVRQDRPRMLITPDDVEPLRDKCQGAGRAMFEAMKKRADGMMGSQARLDNQGRYYLPTYAAMYLITSQRRYADKAKEWFELLSRETIQNPWTCLEYIPRCGSGIRLDLSDADRC